MELSDAQKEFLSLADNVDRVKGLRNVKAMFGSKKNMKEGIDQLEDLGLIEKKALGVWEITEKGSNKILSRVSCPDCNRLFKNKEQGHKEGNIFCSHENLNYQIEGFLD